MKSIFFLFGLTLASMSFASEHKIRIDQTSYPSPATIHLKGVQAQIAEQAVIKCGAQQRVVGLSDIKISISNGIENGERVATVSSRYELLLDYPRFVVTAIVECH